MTPEIFALCVFAAALELDTTYAFQFTLSRGIIAAPLMGLITGDLAAGIQIGIFTELLFADTNPLGGVLPPSAVVCSAVSLALHMAGAELYFAFFFGVVTSILFSFAEKMMRKNRFRWLVYWERQILHHPASVNRAVFFSLGSSFLINFVLLILFVAVCGQLLLSLLPHIPVRAHVACRFAYMAVPWIGLATLIPSFRLKSR